MINVFLSVRAMLKCKGKKEEAGPSLESGPGTQLHSLTCSSGAVFNVLSIFPFARQGKGNIRVERTFMSLTFTFSEEGERLMNTIPTRQLQDK